MSGIRQLARIASFVMAFGTLLGCAGRLVCRVYAPRVAGPRYATGCVASLSARMLDEGRTFCVLYTDLANPTSNAIYARIGYRGIRDFELYDLSP